MCVNRLQQQTIHTQYWVMFAQIMKMDVANLSSAADVIGA